MKIRIEISSGNMSYILDKEVRDIHPNLIQDCIKTIEDAANSCAPDEKACVNCKNWIKSDIEKPCSTCLWDDNYPAWEPVDN